MPHVLVELREPEHRFSVVGRRPEDLAAAASVAAEQRRQLCARMAGGDDRLAAAFEAAFARGQLLDADDVVRAGLADEVMRPPLGFR
jgi:ATP-dependent protease ClpP protease subunit